MGVRLLNIWDVLHPDDDPLPMVKSIEDDGSFAVVDYPEHFCNIIDQLIRNFHQELLDHYRSKRREEAASPPATTKLPDKKVRARIPVKNIPVWKSK